MTVYEAMMNHYEAGLDALLKSYNDYIYCEFGEEPVTKQKVLDSELGLLYTTLDHDYIGFNEGDEVSVFYDFDDNRIKGVVNDTEVLSEPCEPDELAEDLNCYSFDDFYFMITDRLEEYYVYNRN